MNAQLVRRIAEQCYVPMNRLLLNLIARHQGKFRLALSVTGTALEQFEAYAPDVLQGLHALAQTDCVEFLGETYYHSLAALAAGKGASTDPAEPHGEFREQVELHRRMIKRLFGQTPTVFRNTELIYSNAIGTTGSRRLGFKAVLAEGWDPVLNNRSAAFLYHAVEAPPGKGDDSPAAKPVVLLLRNHRLSDAIAYQFSNPKAPDYPLTDEKFALLVSQIGGRLCNLFMDYETFGEHQSAKTGIFRFLDSLPAKLLEHSCDFKLPSDLIRPTAPSAVEGELEVETAGELDVPQAISWADAARDLGAWLGNAMQVNAAMDDLYALESAVKNSGDAQILADWRRLTTSDHFYYMSTKGAADGQVHGYFRPYDSPYDAYINFMNVLDSLRARVS